MTEFQYQIRDKHGATRDGNISAESRPVAVRKLRDRGWIVLSLQGNALDRGQQLTSRIRSGLPVRSLDIETGLQQMAVMIRSGVTILAAAADLGEQRPNLPISRIWTAMADHVRRGRSISSFMDSQSVFPGYVTRLVQIGEQTGNLHLVLERAAAIMRDRRQARESVVLATVYPALLLLLSVLISVYMLVYLMPRLDSYLNSLGKQMPPMTQILIDVSHALQDNAMILGVGSGLLVLASLFLVRSESFRKWFDRAVFRVPLLGNLMRLKETRVFARSLAMMLKSGITLTDSLTTVEQMTDNRYLKATIATIRQKIINGSNLVDALGGQIALTSLLTRMVAAGEQSGQLGQVLEETSELHESQFRFLVKRMTAVATPAATILIGGIVGYIYIAFFSALVAAGT